MHTEELQHTRTEQVTISSAFLKRDVTLDLYMPLGGFSRPSLLLINDGQNLEEMRFAHMLDALVSSGQVQPLLCVGIHAGTDRKNEYGTARTLDYLGRGAKAAAYNRFVLEELLPFIHTYTGIDSFTQTSFAGFSLGGLTALDMVWHYPQLFSIAGVFSGSLWWRTKSLEDDYDDNRDRIMHHQVRNSGHRPGLRFYFATGSLDETADRNNNGIIDSIDDTLALIEELAKLGYDISRDIRYINYEDGRHDIATWGKAMPAFLLWAFGREAASF
jgi:enterochelin esterase-like enzyme